MKSIRHVLWSLAVVAPLAAAQQPAAQSSPASRELRALFDAAWDRDMREDPIHATYVGDRRFEREWPDSSEAAFKRRHADDAATLEKLRRIDRAALGSEDQLSYDLFQRDYEARVGLYPFKPRLYELRTSEGVHTRSDVAELLPFATAQDYEAWIARLQSLGRHIDQSTEQLQVAIREKRTQPKVIMEQIGRAHV